ncbi:MAG: AAA family ATPase [Streptosporangiaceae bacterium]
MAAAPVGLTDQYLPVNPYASYGSPVTGDEFIGRAGYIRSIRGRTFASMEAASISIVGPPRVGKSSLARYVLDEFAQGKNPRGLTFLPVWITVSGVESDQALFRELADHTQVWLADHEYHNDRLQAYYEAVAQTVSWDDMRLRLMTYLQQLRRNGFQVVAVLDEFDAARTVFKTSIPFEFLRSLAYEPDVRVALITTSRRVLEEIVRQSPAELSTFPQTFGLPETLGCFNDAELTALLARSPYTSPELRAALFAWLSLETGGQPFLSAALLAMLHAWWSADGPPDSQDEAEDNFREAVVTCGQLILEHHKSMLELLRGEERLGKLLEVVFGPQVTAGPLDAGQLSREGIIKPTKDGWVAYSESFRQYLGQLEDTLVSEDHVLWRRTEIRLRTVLAAALESAYPDGWENRLRESQPRIVRNCESRRRAHVPQTSGVPDDNLLDYTQPAELLDILMEHWDQAEPLFGHRKEEWRTRLEFAARMRVPLMHSRRTGMTTQDLEHFRGTCQEILKWLAPSPGGRA